MGLREKPATTARVAGDDARSAATQSGGHVHQLYYSSPNWVDQDLTSLGKGPQVANESALASFADSSGEHVYYIGSDSHVHQLYY